MFTHDLFRRHRLKFMPDTELIHWSADVGSLLTYAISSEFQVMLDTPQQEPHPRTLLPSDLANIKRRDLLSASTRVGIRAASDDDYTGRSQPWKVFCATAREFHADHGFFRRRRGRSRTTAVGGGRSIMAPRLVRTSSKDCSTDAARSQALVYANCHTIVIGYCCEGWCSPIPHLQRGCC